MPSLPAKPCLHLGCRELVKGGSRCPQHQATRDREWEERRSMLRLLRQDRYELYRTPEWKRLRAAVLAEELLCRCGCGERSEVVDHIKPHRGDRELFFARSNLQALCKRCHDQKTSREDSWNTGKDRSQQR